MSGLGKIDCYGLTGQGAGPADSQDQFLVADLRQSLEIRGCSFLGSASALTGETYGHLLAVADGIGGNPGGQRAAALALEAVVRYLLDRSPPNCPPQAADERRWHEYLESALRQGDARLRAEADREGGQQEMGTTLTMGYVVWPVLFVAHAGDSRCYLHRNRRLKQLTVDHTFAQKLVEAGILERNQVRGSRWQNVLSNALGGRGNQVQPEVARHELAADDALLLCTDGLTKHVSDRQIEDILNQNSTARTTCEQLLRAARRGGGADENTTIVLARFSRVPARSHAGRLGERSHNGDASPGDGQGAAGSREGEHSEFQMQGARFYPLEDDHRSWSSPLGHRQSRQ